jgi:hypothetical protein
MQGEAILSETIEGIQRSPRRSAAPVPPWRCRSQADCASKPAREMLKEVWALSGIRRA